MVRFASVAAIVGGVGLLTVVGFELVVGLSDGFNPHDFGLGRNTTSVEEVLDGRKISSLADEMNEVMATARALKTEGHRVALWVGASQLHAINQIKDGDHVAVVHANRLAKERGSDWRFVQVSEPNANFHELWAILHSFLSGASADQVILGYVYDDLREMEIRPGLRSQYQQAPINPEAIAGGTEEKASEPAAMLATDETWQAQVEDSLVGFAEGVWPSFAHRDRARSYIGAHSHQLIVMALFALTTQPQVKASEERIAFNEPALEHILRFLQERNIPTLVYKAPHRPGMSRFLHPRQAYDAYAAKVKKLSANYGARFVDLETIVEGELYGINTAGQPDCFHFQDAGHRRLGQTIANEILSHSMVSKGAEAPSEEARDAL